MIIMSLNQSSINVTILCYSEEKIPVDANPVYGIYDEGALYSVVEDGNDYYES